MHFRVKVKVANYDSVAYFWNMQQAQALKSSFFAIKQFHTLSNRRKKEPLIFDMKFKYPEDFNIRIVKNCYLEVCSSYLKLARCHFSEYKMSTKFA